MSQPSPPPSSAPLPAILCNRTVAVLGAGRVGSAVATLLSEAGLRVVAVTTRSSATAALAAERTGAPAGTDNAAAAAMGDIVLVTTNDDAIAGVIAEVAEAGGFGRPGQLVAHMSGALPLSVLAPAAEAGAVIGSAHPMQSFATTEDALCALRGSTFGITSGPGAGETIEALVTVLGGDAVAVADAAKPLYHAAAVVASNYLVAVEDMAVHLLVKAGFDKAAALAALQPLVAGTARNVGTLGTTNALTGPIARGDVAVVRDHIEALRRLSGSELQLYRALGRQTLEIAIRRNTLSAETVRALRESLADNDCTPEDRRQEPPQ